MPRRDRRGLDVASISKGTTMRRGLLLRIVDIEENRAEPCCSQAARAEPGIAASPSRQPTPGEDPELLGSRSFDASFSKSSCQRFMEIRSGYRPMMISAIFDAILMVLGLILDIITLPFRLVAALLGGAEFEFQRFSHRRSR
jgi:hypothetical protein